MKSTESQESQIREYLETGRSLTPYQALVKFSSLRLSARIHRLKTRDGVNIDSEWFETPTGKRVKKYFITK